MVRAGIFGAGFIARVHAHAYASLPNVQLAAVVDPLVERAETLAGQYGAVAGPGIETMLEAGVDIVSVCTPTPLHAELSAQAMRAGMHVLCEKPIARTLEQAEMMLRVARETGATLMVGHVSRYEVDHRRAKDLLDQGDLGRLCMGFQSITGSFPEWSAGGWFADAERSGGPILDLAIHSLDYLLWLFNRPVRRVYAVGRRAKLAIPTYAVVTLGFEGGGIGLVEVSWAHPEAQGLQVRTELAGTGGRLHWDYEGIAAMHVLREGASRRSVVMPGENSFRSEIADFVRAVERREPAPISGEEATAALRVALAAIESLETDTAVLL